MGKFNHLGLREWSKRSTLAHANDHRSWQIYQQLCFAILEQARSEAPARRKFRFKNKLYSLDSSVIDLCDLVFDWAHFRRTKEAVKLHLLFDHNGYLLAFACITEGKTHDVNLARFLTFAPGTIVAVDRGYFDFDLFHRWTDDRIFFFTRLKCNAVYEVIEERLPPQNSNVLHDRVIRFSSPQRRKARDHLYLVVVVWDEENQRKIALLTNHLEFGATTIAANTCIAYALLLQ